MVTIWRQSLIHPFQAGCQRGALAGTGRPTDQDNPDCLRDPFTEHFGRETKRFQIRNIAANSAEDGRVSTKLSKQVHPEPNAFSGSKARIIILPFRAGAARSAERIEERAIERSGLERPKSSGDSQQRRATLMKKQIGSLVSFAQRTAFHCLWKR